MKLKGIAGAIGVVLLSGLLLVGFLAIIGNDNIILWVRAEYIFGVLGATIFLCIVALIAKRRYEGDSISDITRATSTTLARAILVAVGGLLLVLLVALLIF
jgi:hypothetical protein